MRKCPFSPATGLGVLLFFEPCRILSHTELAGVPQLLFLRSFYSSCPSGSSLSEASSLPPWRPTAHCCVFRSPPKGPEPQGQVAVAAKGTVEVERMKKEVVIASIYGPLSVRQALLETQLKSFHPRTSVRHVIPISQMGVLRGEITTAQRELLSQLRHPGSRAQPGS